MHWYFLQGLDRRSHDPDELSKNENAAESLARLQAEKEAKFAKEHTFHPQMVSKPVSTAHAPLVISAATQVRVSLCVVVDGEEIYCFDYWGNSMREKGLPCASNSAPPGSCRLHYRLWQRQ